MKIAIIGYGKMGHAVAQVAGDQGIEIASTIDPVNAAATHKSITEASLAGADVAVDFSEPGSALSNIRKVSKLGANMVVGTTGWYGDLAEARRSVKRSGTGLVYGPNFSIGVSLFFRLVQNASAMMNRFPSYDPFVYEIHHRQKLDSPSGTAKQLGDLMVRSIGRKKGLAVDRVDGARISPDLLHVVSVRAGNTPGTHVVGFDGEYDTIELKHTARSRAGFAEGAIAAARWVDGRKGFFTFDEVVSELAGLPP